MEMILSFYKSIFYRQDLIIFSVYRLVDIHYLNSLDLDYIQTMNKYNFPKKVLSMSSHLVYSVKVINRNGVNL